MKRTKNEEQSLFDSLFESTAGLIVFSMLALAMSLFFILIPGQNKATTREEAVSYTGQFKSYESSKKYCYLCFADGSEYEVYPHTETWEFRERMQAIPEGTTLYLLINPHTDYVVEIRTDTEELMNFDAEQQAIDNYDNGYVWLGGFLIACAAFLLWFALKRSASKSKEQNKQNKKAAKREDGFDDTALRRADPAIKQRVLLTKKIVGYEICYRRVKSTNELVINGLVYDEKKAVIEFEHTLSASLDGHLIEAGLDRDSYSFIAVDGEIIEQKKRLV